MKRLRLLLLTSLIVILAGCVPGTATPPTGPAQAPTQGNQVTATLEGAPAPPASATIIPTPTLAAPERLTTQELHARLDVLSLADASCALPCFHGLTPGQGGLTEALNFYAQLGIGPNDLIPGDYDAAQDGTGRLGAWLTRTTDVAQATSMGLAPPLVDIYLDQNVVQRLYVGWQYEPPYLTMPALLSAWGEPPRLDLGLDFNTDPASFVVVAYYPDKLTGLAVFGQTSGDQANRQVCVTGDPVTATFLGIFAPEDPPMAGVTDAEYLLPLEETLGISYADFSARVADSGCLTIPAVQWTPWQQITPEP